MKRPRVEDQGFNGTVLESRKIDSRGTFSIKRIMLIFLVAISLIFLLVNEMLKPIEKKISDRYLMRGDQYFTVLNYTKAEKEYQKALEYNSGNLKARQNLDLVKVAPIEIAKTRDFFVEKGVSEMVKQIDLATTDYTTPKEALAVGVAFYEKGDWALSQYPLQKAVSLDSQYPEAWHYLGLVYERLSSIDSSYSERAKAAFAKRDELTPEYLLK